MPELADMHAFVEGIPKAELHVHLEGTLEPGLKLMLAKRNDVALPYADEAEMRLAYDFNDLSSFLDVYYEGTSVLAVEQDFYDLTLAYLEKAHSQNVVYAEMFFDPQTHTSRGIEFATVITGIRRAQIEGETRYGIRTQLIMCFLRNMSAASAMTTLEQSLPYRDWIVGVGLDSDERDNPPVKFRDVFSRARDQGLRVTMHCDVDQENSLDHIRQCLDEIGVERIDHGINAVEDEELCEEINRRGLGLTVCPISNSLVAGGLKEEQVMTMLDRGMLVCINSDDPAYFPGYMHENLIAIAQAASLTRANVVRLVRNAFEMAWLSAPAKAVYLDALKAYTG